MMPRLISLLLHDVYVRDPAESGFPGAAADRYKMPLPEFDAALSVLHRVRHGPTVLVTGLDRGELDGTPADGFAFTVDDGGESYYTLMADRLEEHGWRGHCFVSTDMIGRPGFLGPRQIAELDRRGHVVGSHSATHPTRFSAIPRARMLEEWRRSRQDLEDVLGREVRVASLPGGYYSRTVAIAAREAGLNVLFTSEPTLRARDVGGCLVVGRLGVRPGRGAAAVAALAVASAPVLWREWAVWTAKKAIKPVLGPAYPRLGHWAARLGR
jgi:peptidoglycan/xylan/chitin deacetylase (PgdA/CDA1 family)